MYVLVKHNNTPPSEILLRATHVIHLKEGAVFKHFQYTDEYTCVGRIFEQDNCWWGPTSAGKMVYPMADSIKEALPVELPPLDLSRETLTISPNDMNISAKEEITI